MKLSPKGTINDTKIQEPAKSAKRTHTKFVRVFFQTRKTAAWLVERMQAEGHAVALLSGELTVEERIKILDNFRDGHEKILITTNVMARGIDVEQVTIVVNYDLPVNADGTKADCETYLHRIGRTGKH